MKQTKKIDILLATYNGATYIREQIESILNQNYQNIQLIISDDKSTDNTVEILKEYEKKDERVKIYLQEQNLGYINNFEFLLKQVENEIYMLSDQDDVWLPEKIEKTLEQLEKEQADLVFGDLEVVDKELNTIYPSFNEYMLLDRKIKKQIGNYKLEYLYNCVTGCTIMSKKEWVQKILPIPIDCKKYVAHDHWMGLIIALNGKIAYVDGKYIKYRQHGKNQIGTDKISHHFETIEQVRKHFIDVKLGIFSTYTNHKESFPKILQSLNEKALKYYQMIEKKKINFKNWSIFHELYKDETISYYFSNFLILNMPIFLSIPFKIRYFLLKRMGKR